MASSLLRSSCALRHCCGLLIGPAPRSFHGFRQTKAGRNNDALLSSRRFQNMVTFVHFHPVLCSPPFSASPIESNNIDAAAAAAAVRD